PVIPSSKDGAVLANGEIGLPLGARGRIGVQLQRSAKGLSFVRGANVIDVAGVAVVAVLGIDVVNNAVVGGWLAPALVSPVAAAIRKHAGEVPHSSHTRSGEFPARIGVGPSIPSVRRPVE